uniref:ABC transporter domain-containing protein n=1 Tax=Graphocephala atropunctata TaxID=36148 RepID=A0A1B6KVQ4_9HEMI
MALQEIPLETFSNKSKTKLIELRFNELNYKVNMGFRKGEKEILHNVCGYFLPGQLTAIMGPSGAGKSSLLDVMSGYRISGVDGSVTVNGKLRDLNQFRRISCYIQQDDRLQPLLTVAENMRVAADLKLPRSVSLADKENTISEILNTLGLKEAERTQADRLSGGQKKRLSIALELINNPLVMFLDEPTTGLDSSSCTQCVSLLKVLALQGRTIICTIHQPSAMLFQKFDIVYVLASGRCLYQGTTGNMVPYLLSEGLPCPKYHNPADYVIELACGEHGNEQIEKLVRATQNGRSLEWFENAEEISTHFPIVHKKGVTLPIKKCVGGLQETPLWNQVSVLLRRGFIKVKRDKTLTHLRLIVNIFTGIMLGTLWLQVGDKGSRVLDNYNLLFSILIHHVMSTMMLAILTFPMEMTILTKEHFNRWYSLKSFFISVNVVDFPVPVVCCIIFSAIIYAMSGQPMDSTRFTMFTVISLLVVFIAQSIGFMVGAIFNIVNGTFVGPVLVVPMMMFSGFGVRITDIPAYLQWGTTFSYLRYSLEGYVAAIYENRTTLPCDHTLYCHYRYPRKFLEDVGMPDDQFWNDIIALTLTLVLAKVAAYLLLRWKIQSMR